MLGASLAAQRRDGEAEALMLAADRAFKPIPGRQLRDRDLNRERLQRLRDARETRQRAKAFSTACESPVEMTSRLPVAR